MPYWGVIATYYGGGYAAFLPGKFIKAEALLDSLYENMWIDRYSRAIFIEFTIFNANANIFSRIQFLFELTNVGSILSTHEVQTLQLFNYVGPAAYFTIFCQLSLIGFLIFFFVREIKKLKTVSDILFIA